MQSLSNRGSSETAAAIGAAVSGVELATMAVENMPTIIFDANMQAIDECTDDELVESSLVGDAAKDVSRLDVDTAHMAVNTRTPSPTYSGVPQALHIRASVLRRALQISNLGQMFFHCMQYGTCQPTPVLLATPLPTDMLGSTVELPGPPCFDALPWSYIHALRHQRLLRQ